MKLFLVSVVALCILVSSANGIPRTKECSSLRACPEKPCSIVTCVEGRCISEAIICDIPQDDPCSISMGCNPEVGYCVYDRLYCNDHDPCTTDTCVRSTPNASMPICHFEKIDKCDSNDVSKHTATITVVSQSALSVSIFEETTIQFCHTSSYYGNDTSIVLGFDDYVPCNMPERGTCDNQYSEWWNNSEEYCVSSPIDGSYPCIGDPNDNTFTMPGLSTTLQWVGKPTFTLSDSGDGRLTGFIVDKEVPNDQVSFAVDLWFYQLQYGGKDPIKELPPACYNGNIISQWRYHNVIKGTFKGMSGSQYAGAILNVVERSPELAASQIGMGANGKNDEMGMLAHFSWNVVRQPTSQVIYDPVQHGVIRVDLKPGCNVTESNYCDYFAPFVNETVTNGWFQYIDESWSKVIYCANFTLDELLHCRNFSDRIGRLFTYNETLPNGSPCGLGNLKCIISYDGQFHYNAVENKVCHGWPEICDESIISHTLYDISLQMKPDFAVQVEETPMYLLHPSKSQWERSRMLGSLAKDIDFSALWMGNVWLSGDFEDAGNLKVKIQTSIFCNENSFPALLCNPRVLSEEETGEYPLSFIDTASQLTITDGHILQEWALRSFGASERKEVVDFSGTKPLIWDVCIMTDNNLKSIVIGSVQANVALQAIHVGLQTHTDGQTEASLELYMDRTFTLPYNESESIVETDSIYALLSLTNYQHLDIEIGKVYICYSLERDLLQANVSHANVTGCNTQGEDVVQVLIYSTDFDELTTIEWMQHQFTFLQDPPDSNLHYVKGFAFIPRVYTRYQQTIGMTWYASEPNSNGALIEFISETPWGTQHSEFRESSHDLHVTCPDGWSWHENDDDHDHHNHHCFRDLDDWDWDNGWWVFLFLGFLLIFFLCLGCCYNYSRTSIAPYFSEPPTKLLDPYGKQVQIKYQ